MSPRPAPEAASTLTIDSRYRGPAASGNGGYCCGRLAALLDDPCAVQVRLKRPPPLGRPLLVQHRGDQLLLRDGDDLVAEAQCTDLDLRIPDPPELDDARAMSARYRGFEDHPFPECFVCGPARQAGDGLRIFAGRRRPGEIVAAPWVPDVSVTDAAGLVEQAVLWAALDCPGYFAVGAPGQTALLGTMAAQVTAPVYAGEPCVVVGWPLGQQGRKLFAATALFGRSGALLGKARQVWITV